MTTYTVTSGFALHGKTLAANVEDVVTLPAHLESSPEIYIWPGGNSTVPVYFTIDGTAATIGGSNCYIAFSGAAVTPQISAPAQYAVSRVVRLISAATSTYSITEG